jgi:hypothetical protein
MYEGAAGALMGRTVNRESRAVHALYSGARARGQRGQFWARLTGRSRCLIDLASVEANCKVDACREGRLRAVPIEQIQGSEGRTDDFDRDFNPLQEHTRNRWLSVAAAWRRGQPLPPVDLIQVGDVYFVRDGHHRISVARTMGQKAIDARVIVWRVDGSLPWERQAQGPSPVQPRSHDDPGTPAGGWHPASILDWLSGLLQPAEPGEASQRAR